MVAFARSERSALADWFWTVDRWALLNIAVLIAFGVLLSLAASPAIAESVVGTPYHFVVRHLLFLLPSVAILIGFSMLSPKRVFQAGAVLLAGGMLGVFATLFMAPDIKGASRWIPVGPFAIQPSEFLKPGFAIVAAWLFARWNRVPGFPGVMLSLSLLGTCAVLLLNQPDVGQTVLIFSVWAILFFTAGMPLVWAVGAVAGGGVLAAVAYMTQGHVRDRIDAFLNPAADGTDQLGKALESFREGGLTGVGAGEGSVKMSLPDAHADFIFAVAGEEFGLIVPGLILFFIGLFVLRAVAHGLEERDHFVQLAVIGLAALFGLQALINLGVNTGMLPPKGMTLPFISYGGSSMLSMACTAGMLLALTRRRVRGTSRYLAEELDD